MVALDGDWVGPEESVKNQAVQASKFDRKDFGHGHEQGMHYDGGLFLDSAVDDEPDGLGRCCLRHCLFHCLFHENAVHDLGAAQDSGTVHGDPSLEETCKGSSTMRAVHVGTNEHCHDQ